jgi:hypothetical protein
MKRNLSTICLLLFALAGSEGAQTVASSAASGSHYSEAQLKKLAQNAHTSEEYGVLASYYGQRHNYYLTQATEEKQEWARRSSNIVLTAAKYPRPVDSAHYLYDYYTYKALEASQLAAKFAQLAAPATPAGAK